jgi:hypothetical protein
MNLASGLHSRLWVGAALIPTTLAAMVAGSSVGEVGSTRWTAPAPTAPTTVATASDAPAGAGRVVLRVRDGLATATLDDTPAARGFAAMLPLRLTLHDPMGQAKSGRLPHRIDVSSADRVLDPDTAAIYYWPPSGDIGIVYDDLGPTVPPPGMVRLATIDTGLDTIASAGNQFTIWIDSV